MQIVNSKLKWTKLTLLKWNEEFYAYTCDYLCACVVCVCLKLTVAAAVAVAVAAAAAATVAAAAGVWFTWFVFVAFTVSVVYSPFWTPAQRTRRSSAAKLPLRNNLRVVVASLSRLCRSRCRRRLMCCGRVVHFRVELFCILQLGGAGGVKDSAIVCSDSFTLSLVLWITSRSRLAVSFLLSLLVLLSAYCEFSLLFYNDLLAASQ